jgi:hypothetical protein
LDPLQNEVLAFWLCLHAIQDRYILGYQLIVQQQKEIAKINTVSGGATISSLGDVRVFLQGFNNGENLHTTLDSMNQQMLRFQKTGDIN